MNVLTPKGRKATVFIFLFSLVAVALLLLILTFKPLSGLMAGHEDWKFLGGLNALFNGVSAVCISIGLYCIKNQRRIAHKRMMLLAGLSSTLFLISYIFYHSLYGSLAFLGVGWVRPIYFTLLITHVVLAIVVLPFVLLSFFLGLSLHFTAHKKIARYTAPVWLYVSVTGVLVYLLLQAYNPSPFRVYG